LRALLAALPVDLPAAVAVVLHLAPHERSHLHDTVQNGADSAFRPTQTTTATALIGTDSALGR
jgi:hypothetical protein